MGSALALAMELLSALPALIEAGRDIAGLVKEGNETLAKAQAEGRDPTKEEWDELNKKIAELRAELHG